MEWHSSCPSLQLVDKAAPPSSVLLKLIAQHSQPNEGLANYQRKKIANLTAECAESLKGQRVPFQARWQVGQKKLLR